MNSTAELEVKSGTCKAVLRGVSLACLWGLTASANAVVDEEPYFQLFPGAPYDFNTGDSPGNALGDDFSVNICGATDGASCTAEITVEVLDENPGGTGFIYSFLRLNEPNNAGQSSDGTPLDSESGYNTNYPDLQQDGTFDNDSQDSPGAGNEWNRAVLISDLEVFEGNYLIQLDLNEQGNNPDEYIRLDEFELHTSTGTGGELWDYNPNHGPLGSDAGTFGSGGWDGMVFDMDVWKEQLATDNPAGDPGFGGLTLKTCEGIAPTPGGKCGSGTLDYLFKIPVDLLGDGEWLHLVATLGTGTYDEDGWNPEAFAGAGFDEFAAYLCAEGQDCEPPEPPTGVPVPGTAFLVGMGLLGLGRIRRRSAA